MTSTTANDHSARAHARLSASGAARWTQCPGSVNACAHYPRTSSKAADEGTAAHELAEWCLTTGQNPGDYPGDDIDVDGTGYPITNEMCEAVSTYLVAVCSINGARHVEVKLTGLAEVDPDFGGTADAVIIRPDVLHVVDLKYGQGVFVDPTRNRQLILYAIGAIRTFGLTLSVNHPVRLVVVQPRHPQGPPVRMWETTAGDLEKHAFGLKVDAAKTREPNAPLRAGEHCKFCPHQPVCPALRQLVADTAQVDFAAVGTAPPAPDTLTAEQLGAIEDRAELIEDWLKQVHAHSKAEALAGRPPTGRKLVAGRGSRAWRDAKAAETFLRLYGCDDADLFDVPTLRSPAQIEKVVGRASKSDLDALIVSSPGAPILVRADDKRPSIAVDAKADFAALTIDTTEKE